MSAYLRFLTGGIAGIAVAGMLAGPAVAAPPTRNPLAAPAAATAKTDQTSLAEARRVDRVPTPKLDWYPCYDYAECATARLPLDYDKPNGPTVEIAVLRVKAKDQKRKIGSVFLNPGGPGGSGTAIALAAPYFASGEMLDRFDIVGFDPRGIAYSDQVRCFRTLKEQASALAGMNVFFPYSKAEERDYIASARRQGKACSTTGRPLSGSMSTAEVARDMDVLRRAVGDRKLTYLGFSYGTALGQYYANMFPDRIRALAIDGVLNPVSWVGTRKTQDVLLDDRLRSADGADKALREIFVRCDRAGTELCPLAGHAARDFDLVARRLKANPLVIEDPTGEFVFSYAAFVGNALGMLYDPYGYDMIVQMTADLLVLTDPDAATTAAERATARRGLAARLAKTRLQTPGRDFPYDNGLDALSGVLCTDSLHPKDAALWPKLTAQADRRAPYFGRAWGWSSAMCARNSWTVQDEDAYRGPFNRRTSAPVLVVGNYWDPATNYNDAVSSAALLPNSRLLSSDSWGHTAYGTSACVTGAVDQYLLRGVLPAKGAVCVGDVQPFATSQDQRRTADAARTQRPATTLSGVAEQGLPAAGDPKQLPPVVAPASLLPLS